MNDCGRAQKIELGVARPTTLIPLIATGFQPRIAGATVSGTSTRYGSATDSA
jgi:hypothetical protein